ncbi:MAG: TRAP transporter large permease subunit, partial [Deltaproteobacteria bacterium]
TSLRKGTRLTKVKVAAFLEIYARMFAPLFVIVIGIAVLVSAIMGVGAQVKLGNLLLGGIQEWYFLALITASIVIVLGMAIPLSAAYLAGVTIVAPILAFQGHQPLIIHMFIFSIATLAPITPPVAMATFTAARIAGANMMQSGLEATVRALPLWIFPFAIFKKELLFGVGTPLSVIGIEVAILCLGVFIFILGIEGYFQGSLKIFERISAIAIGIMIVQPISEFYSRIFIVAGILLLVFWGISSFLKKRKTKKSQAY